ncbi:hypothetical protein [Anaeromyxobacter soli]|uniref:hypothetical protein n=1 Tax=Anaeromyxobacter soli TaxID=2922725 RepID=UPI001FAEC2D4|nr:hypothetical protein [Anaeromyxobacter sp. SG29]
MDATKHRVLSLVMVLALAGCSGGSNGKDGRDGLNGQDGAAGPVGPSGQDGADGRSTGGVMGKLTFKVAGKEYPATNVTVTSIPDWCGTATSDANGEYELGSGCAIGVYTIVFSGNGFKTLEVPNISIAAGKEYILNRELTAISPLVLKAAKPPNPAGFEREVTLGVTVTGGTPPYTYKWTPRTTNPTAVTLSANDVEAPTFTTGALADIVAADKKVIGFGPSLDEEGKPFRPEFLGVSNRQLTEMTYNFDVVVTDQMGFEGKVTVAVVPATLAQANGSIPTGTLVIASIPGNAAALVFTEKPIASSAVLNDADTAFPWFIADAPGVYRFDGLRVAVSNYVSSNPSCGGCHEYLMSAEKQAAMALKFKKWSNSAHGNHFFKYMEYDANGQLVWKTGPDGKPIPAPTANPTVFWTEPGAMTTFEYGMTGAEGTHYGENCVACHTTGYNAALQNDGFDDVAKAAGWTFPDLSKYLTGLTGTPPDLVTTEPQYGAWDLVPADAKAYAGMQCESCHGPLGRHAANGGSKPVGEYGVAACAVCHDRPTNHDRVALWRRSGHANTGLAFGESTGARANSSCARCHSAQGFVKYAANTLQDSVDSGATKENVEPQTCAACHDSHSTTVRIDGKAPVYVAAGFTVSGAGTGALCMTCHNGRRGLRGDAVPMTGFATPHAPTQTEVLMGMNAYFIGDANGYKVSGHAAVSETCVGCHMKTAVEGLRYTITNHTFGFTNDAGFDAAKSICKECHGEEVNGEAIETAYANARAQVIAQLSATLEAAVAGTAGFTVTPAGAGHGAPEGTPLVLALTNIASIDVEGTTIVFNLVAAVDVTFPSGTVSTKTVRASAGKVTDATGAFALAGVDGVLSRSLWNLGLVNDGSNAIHNPTFVFEVLQATDEALKAATPAAACAATCL